MRHIHKIVWRPNMLRLMLETSQRSHLDCSGVVGPIRHLMASNIRQYQLHNLFLETGLHGLVIVGFPDSLRGFPFAVCVFDATLQFGLLKINSQSEDDRPLRQGPTGLFNISSEATVLRWISLATAATFFVP